MALPNSLSSTRISSASAVSGWPTAEAALETALCDILGIPINTSITAAALTRDSSGRITSALPESIAAGGSGWRFRDSTSGKEFRVNTAGTNFTIDENTGTEGTPVWTNRFTVKSGTNYAAGPAFAAITDGGTVANTVTETSFAKTYAIPANTLVAGSMVRIHAMLNITSYSGGGSWTLRTKVAGQQTGSYQQVNGATGGQSLADVSFLRSIGAGGTIIGSGGAIANVSGGANAAATVTTAAIDTTVNQNVDITWQWSTASAGNSVTLKTMSVEVLPPGSTA